MKKFDYLNYKNKIPLDKVVIGKIPKLNPYSIKYKNYWKDTKRKIIEGYWVNNEEGLYQWVPPILALYNNLWTIEMSRKGSKSQNKIKGTPRLRDVEWIKGFIWAYARGFSGFEFDDEFTCSRLLSIPEEIEENLIYVDGHIKDSIYNSKGELKKYVPVLEYLYTYKNKALGKPQFFNPALNVADIECRNIGKDLRWDSIIYREDGSKDIIDNVNIGDKIFGANGELTTIISKEEFNDQMQYEIEFQDGRKVYCGKGHLWTVIYRGKELTLELKDIISGGYKFNRKNGYPEYKYRVQLNKPVNTWKEELEIDPYYLGLWLGDGSKHDTSITSNDIEIGNYIKEYSSNLGLNTTVLSKNSTDALLYRPSVLRGSGNNILLDKLRSYNLLNNKHIPDIYFRTSIEDRLNLLKGVLDSGGSCDKTTGFIEFSNINYSLIKDVENLCRSLGIRCTLRNKKTSWKYKGINNSSTAYRLHINTELDLFKLKRKSINIRNNSSKKSLTSQSSIAIVNITPVEVDRSICIGIDNKDKLFLTNDYIVTHNSFISSAMVGQNFLSDGAMDYDELLELIKMDEAPMSETLVGAIDSKYSTGLINKLKLGLDSLPGDIEIGDMVFPSPISKKYTGSFMSGKHIISEYEKKIGSNWTKAGSKSRILHRSFGDNPFAANGTRPGFIVIDEIGFMGNLEESLGQMAECTTQDGRKFGSIWMTGTGGDMTSGATEAIKKVFYDPKAFDCIELDDIFEDKGKIGLFIPAWMALDDFRDELGNVNKEAALKVLLKEREIASKAKSKQKLYDLLQMKPLVPSEAFLVMEGNIFPIGELKEHLGNLESSEKLKTLGNTGWMSRDADGKSYFKVDHSRRPADYPTRESVDENGAVVVWEEPVDNPPYGLYVAGIDPYDQDKAESSVSYGSIFIYKRLKVGEGTYHLPVAEYTGRPQFANDFYEQCRRLLEWYNAKALYENQNPGLKKYFETKFCTYLLHTQPNIIKQISPNSNVNRGYGIHMPKVIKDEMEIMCRDWLRTELSPGILQLTKILSIPLLKELISYNDTGNFDRVIAFMLCIIMDIELHKIRLDEVKVESLEDNFFNRSLFTNNRNNNNQDHGNTLRDISNMIDDINNTNLI